MTSGVQGLWFVGIYSLDHFVLFPCHWNAHGLRAAFPGSMMTKSLWGLWLTHDMPIWGPGRRFSKNFDVSRTWLPLLNFEGIEIKVQPGFDLLNFMESTICSMLKLSNCLLQYITSEKQCTEACMLYWFEIIGCSILKHSKVEKEMISSQKISMIFSNE